MQKADKENKGPGAPGTSVVKAYGAHQEGQAFQEKQLNPSDLNLSFKELSIDNNKQKPAPIQAPASTV